MENKPYVFMCSCACSDLLPEGKADGIMNKLVEKGVNFRSVSDLCGLVASKSCKLDDLAKAEDLIVIACYPRTIKWLLKMAGIDRSAQKTKVFNMRTQESEEIISGIMQGDTPENVESSGEVEAEAEAWINEWKPWFPVIDYDRCTSCGQCVDFCLFGVYESTEGGKVTVTEPANCKDNCPACARICPQAAIIFPKYTGSPVNGDEITDEEGVTDAIKVNMDEVLGDDVYKALAERRKMARQRRLLKKKDRVNT